MLTDGKFGTDDVTVAALGPGAKTWSFCAPSLLRLSRMIPAYAVWTTPDYNLAKIKSSLVNLMLGGYASTRPRVVRYIHS